MPICFLKKGKKQAAAAPAGAAEPSPGEEGAGSMEHIMTPGAEYSSQIRRLRNIEMVRYNFDDDDYYGAQDEMYYPNNGGYHPPGPGPGTRHMSARSSMPPPRPHCDYDSSNYPYAHYPPALPQPQPHFSPAPQPWQRFSPAPAPWGQPGPRQHSGPPRRHFGPPRPHFGPPCRTFAPPQSYDYYGDY